MAPMLGMLLRERVRRMDKPAMGGPIKPTGMKALPTLADEPARVAPMVE